MEMYLNQTPVCRFSGKVIRGRGLGRLTGMPTANLQVLPDLLPPCGVYVTSLTWRGRPFHGITNIAESPAGGCVSAETHNLNFSENLYGENLSLSLFSRLRLQRSFSTLSRLLDQLRRDCDAVREFFGIRLPENPGKVCDEIEAATGVQAMIVDANDLNIEILGKASSVNLDDETLKGLIRDNPAGQSRELTPFILIRPVEDGAQPAD